MKKIILVVIILLLPVFGYSQTNLNLQPPNISGVGSNMVATYQNVSSCGGHQVDLIVSVNSWSSNISDSSWLNGVMLNASSGDLTLKIPHEPNDNNCISLNFQFVISGTNSSISCDINSLIKDLDSTRRSYESVHVDNGYHSTTYSNTSIQIDSSPNGIAFYSTQSVNVNDSTGYVGLDFGYISSFDLEFCAEGGTFNGNGFFYISFFNEIILNQKIELFGYNQNCVNIIRYKNYDLGNTKEVNLYYSRDGQNFIKILEKISPNSDFYLNADGDSYFYVKVKTNDGGFYNSKTIQISSSCVKGNIDLYPNPTSDNIKIKSNYEIKSIQVIDYVGNVVTHKNNCTSLEQISLKYFSSGVYNIKIILRNNQIKYFKIVKK